MLKDEENFSEVLKHKEYLASLNMSGDEVMTVYNFSIVSPGLFGGKHSTKLDIGHLPEYIKWRNKSFQMVLGYDINKMLDIFHWDIKMITEMQYQP